MVKNYEKILIYFQFLDNIGMYSNGMLYEYFCINRNRGLTRY